MGSKKLYAIYDDDMTLLEAAKVLTKEGVHIDDVFSPFPIHGIDPVIGLPRTRIAITAFIYGMIGVSLALLGMWYFMVYDWPMNIGGKPNFSLFENLPTFVPITFEFGVLCAAHGMAFTYFLRNMIFPGIKPKNPYKRSTDDRFVIEIVPAHNDFEELALKKMIATTGVLDIDVFDPVAH